MGKLCSLSRHITFMLRGMADFECKRVKIVSQWLLLLFTRAENSANLLCSSCKIRWSKPPRGFVKLVEGSVVSKFGIQMFVHFCYKIWRKLESTEAKRNSNRPECVHPRDVAPRRATLAPPSYTRALTPMTACDRRSEAGRRGYYAHKASFTR
jgi:hypothetical protein